ncbi:MAG: FG-GAP-like repeat-containing protein [archaeon]
MNHCNSYTLKGLPDGKYYWSVQAIDNAFAGSSWATEKSFTIDTTPPAAPQNLTATSGNQQVTLCWQKNTEADFLRYRVYGGTSANPTTKIDSTTGGILDTVKVVTGLTNGTTYYFRVTAVDLVGNESGFSNEVSATPTEQFTEQTGISLTGVGISSVAWGDYDNDGDLDILLTGDSVSGRVSKIYRNNGDNTFSEQTGISLTGVYASSVAWGDYDNDGDLDILLTGDSVSGRVSKIYCNNGDNSFTEQTGISITGVYRSSVAWGDYDNDGDLDILLTGVDNNSNFVSKIYSNNCDISFMEQIGISLPGVYRSSAAWGDYDNDGDLDILLTGSCGGPYVSKIYRNNGNNSFTEQTGISMTGVGVSSVAWGDYDNDGDLDILLTGDSETGRVSKIYRNNGDNTFSEQTGISLTGVNNSSVAWGDYDNDGDLDILLTGYNYSSNPISKIYRNNGDNSFAEQTGISLTGVDHSSVAWGDYDNDGDLDILLTGYNGNDRISKIYSNNNLTPNSVPSTPSELTASVKGSNVTFTWNKSSDPETPQNGLTYNLYVSTTPGGCQVKSPMSDNSSGYRKVVQLGNMNHCNSYTLKGLPDGKYYWSVQAIDNAFAGSAFAPVDSFVILPPVPTITSFSPTSGPVGTTVTITGTNFSPITANNIVYFGAVRATVTTANPTSLTVTIPAGATYQPISVSDTTTYLIAYSAKPFIVTFEGCGNITPTSFSPKVDFPLVDSPRDITINDFDGDGRPDLCITNYGGNAISVYRNTSAGDFITDNSFAPIVNFTTSLHPLGIIGGDLNGDGKIDLVVANHESGTFSVFKNIWSNGAIIDSSFACKIDFLTGTEPSDVGTGDLDGDGKLDLVVTNSHNNTVSVFQNTCSSGTVTSNSFISRVDFATGGAPIGVAISDLDGDGKSDLVVANSVSGTISVFRNISSIGSINSGSFVSKIDFTTGASPYHIAIGDLDGDNKPEIVTTNYNNGTISVLQNNCVIGSINSGSFTAKVDFETGTGPYDIAISDLDGDGKLDLIATMAVSNTVSIFRNTSIYGSITNGSFSSRVDFAAGTNPYGIAIGDLDGDSKPDIIVANNSSNTISAYRNCIAGILPTTPQSLTATPGNQQVTLSWQKNTESDFLRYRIYGGTSTNPTTKIDSTTGGILDTVKVITGLTNGTNYGSSGISVDYV